MSAELARAEEYNVSDTAASTARVEDRYAVALLELAQDAGKLAEVEADMVVLADAIASSEDLRTTLNHPIVSRDAQQNILEGIGKKLNLSELTQKFLALVASKKRQNILTDIINAFEAEVARQRGELIATVRSATVLSPEQQAELSRILSSKHKATVKLNVIIDDALLGGMTIQIGDKFYDRTLKSQLTILSQQLREIA
jgi:F-type H+-transporting ATPase subunit delta